MSKERTVEINIKQLIAIAVMLFGIVVVVVALAQCDSCFPLLQLAENPTPSPDETRDPVAARAEEIALAMQIVDYRDPKGWLARLRPLTTEEAYNSLKTSYVGLVWDRLEQYQVIITPGQVTAVDQGPVIDGSRWQVRKVAVHIEDPPRILKSAERTLHLQLLLDGGKWKLQNSLTEDQVALLKAVPTTGAIVKPVQKLPAVQLPTPEPGIELSVALAELFTTSFNTIDYRDQTTWLARMYAMSTSAGYSLITQEIFPQLWKLVEEKRTVIVETDVSVEDRGLVLAGETSLGPYQVRKVYVEAPSIEPGLPTSEEYLIMLVREIDVTPEDIYDGWRFETFLSQGMLDDAFGIEVKSYIFLPLIGFKDEYSGTEEGGRQ